MKRILVNILLTLAAGAMTARAVVVPTTVTNYVNAQQGQVRLPGSGNGTPYSSFVAAAVYSTLIGNSGAGETTLTSLARSIVKFDYPDSLLPAGATLQSAKLRLYVTENTLNDSGAASSMLVYGAATLAPGNYTTSDFSSAAFNTYAGSHANNTVPTNAWLEIDVTSLVASAFAGSSGSTITTGFRLQLNDDLTLTVGNPQPRITFTDNNNSPATMPQLLITTVAAVQHLDASVPASVVKIGSGPVSQWTDLSGNANHATPATGTVGFPSTSLSASDRSGLNFGATGNSLTLFSETAQDSWLDCTTNNPGFCVLVAFKCDAVGDTNDLIGNSPLVSDGFSIRYENSGALRVFMDGELDVSGTVAAGNTIVVALNYDANSGAWTFWNSKDGTTHLGIKMAADFSTFRNVTLGSTISDGRFINGMVGEVKIYDAPLSPAAFLAERQALSQKWVVNSSAPGRWRVIPGDPGYPSDDVIVAYCAVTDAGFGLPVNSITTDCTAAFQAALNAADAAGGGTVYVPEGQYRINGTLTIPSNVTLRGRWRQITASQTAGGTILALYSTGTQPVLTLAGGGAGVRDLTFWHPEQNAKAVAEYPFVITGDSAQITIENINLINAYNGIDLSRSSMCCLRGIYGSPLKVGLTADRSYAVSRYIDIHFSPDYWTWAGLEGSPSYPGAHRPYIRANGLAINIKEMDGFHLIDSSISGYWKGMLFQDGASGDNPWGSIVNTTISNCTYGIHFESAKSIPMLHSTVQASSIAVWAKDHNPRFNSCTIRGPVAFYSESNSNVTLTSCIRSGAVDIGTGTLTENTFSTVPPFTFNYDKVRKPAKTNLYNVKSYGAAGDGVTNDTAAVQAAVAAANANAGGIVLVPAGQYRMTGNLALGTGVELRGSSGGRHVADASQQLGSLLLIETGAGQANGTPFITLGNQSGLRGIGFHYPNQTWLQGFVPYPFMVRGNGLKNYIIDCFAGNPYQAAELNGDDHLVEFTFFGGLKRTYRANNCTGGRIQFCHIKPDFWRDTKLAGNPASDLELFKWNVTKEGLEVFYLNNCTDYSISSIFNHASHTLFTADNSSGQTLLVGGEQLQQGFTFKNGARKFDVIFSGGNINNIGDYGGSHGIKTLLGFKGQARFFSAGVVGSPTDSWSAQDGSLYLQDTDISGPSNRGAMGFSCGLAAKISMEGCSSGEYLGFENQGSVVMKRCSFWNGFLNSYLPQYLPDNSIEKTFVLSDANQNPVRNYGLVLNPGNIAIEDALIFPGSTPPSESTDARRIQAARLTSGSYSLDVTDPDFTNGAKRSVTIESEWYVDTDCTLNINYDSTSGMKLGKSVTYTGASEPGWKTIKFSVTDAQFGSGQDVRIDIIGSSPGLAFVAIQSSQLPPGYPASPTGLVATPANGSVRLNWADNVEGNLAGYRVYRSTTSGSYGAALATGITTSRYVDNSVVNGTDYYYTVTAVNTIMNASASSREVSAMPMAWSASYFTWVNSHGGAGVIGSPTNDYDGDGVPNLVEYALATTPTDVASVARPVVGTIASPTRLSFTYFRARADVTYVVEASANLVAWEVISTDSGAVGQSVTVTDIVTSSGAPAKRFLRLRVMMP